MIKEIELKESKNYEKYKHNDCLYESGIKADTCILLENMEVYYDKENQIIYFESFESFYLRGESLDETCEITNDMFKEIIQYLGWKKWVMKLYYYDYEEAVISIKSLDKKKKNKENKLSIGSLINNYYKSVSLKKVPNMG